MEGQLFYTCSPLFVLLATSMVLMAASLIGYLIGLLSSRRIDDKTEISTVQASVLGMLALLLGFTFGVAFARYDTRRVLAIDEANALGTTFMRAQMLPEPYRTGISRDLRRLTPSVTPAWRWQSRPGTCPSRNPR